MSDPYIGEIRMFAGNFPPAGWAMCEGQLLPISENEPLFTLIGTTYGGDGESTFALPDLRGRAPMHQGASAGGTYVVGQMGGTETVTLTGTQLPGHTHQWLASTDTASARSPAGQVLAKPAAAQLYLDEQPLTAMHPNTLGAAGGSQPHENMPPFLAVSFIISLYGIFPSWA